MTDMIYFTSCNKEIPRIVAAKVKKQLKSKIGFNDCGEKPRISGDLRIVDRSFRHLRYAEIREGCLVLYRYVGTNKVWDFRIALYNLNINLDSPRTYCQFSLSKFGEIAPIATFQVVKETDYKKWLKVLAVEVIRQTPLNTLKFMDILYINELLEKHHERYNKFIRKKSNHTSRENFYNLNETPRLHHSSQEDLNTSDKSNYSHDSGYCSLQSGCNKLDVTQTEVQQPFQEIFKKFEQQNDFKPFKAKIKKTETSCFNLLNKFKRSNVKEPPKDRCSSTEKLDKAKIKFRLCNYLQERMNQERLETPLKLNCKLIHVDDEISIRNKIIESPNLSSISNPCLKNNLNFNDYYKSPQPDVSSAELSQESIPDVLKDLPDTLPRTKRKPSVTFHLPERILQNENANNLVRLLTKCQIDKEYVPVKEKRMLFESLSRFSFSADNLKKRGILYEHLPDSIVKSNSLSSLNKSSVSVSSMKKYFESFTQKNEKTSTIVSITHL